jgi:hypothetical protein
MIWATIAILGGLVVVAGAARMLWSRRPDPEMGGLPATSLEKLGWVGLAVTTAVGGGLAVLVVFEGASFFDENAVARGIFWILVIGGVGVWGAAWYIVKRSSGKAVVDERDRAILARSLSVESMIVLLLLVTWTVVLTEVYWDEGSVPLAYLQLIFWSTFIGGAFGRSVGIILGYHREVDVDA